MTELKREGSGVRPGSGIISRCVSHFALHASRTRLADWSAQLIFWPVLAAGTALDLWSKRVVFNWLQHGHVNSMSIIDGFLRLVLVQNEGAAFGVGAGHPYLLITVSVIALIVVLAVFFLSGSRKRLVHVALGLFAAGVCGNLYDRIFNCGLVRDFIDVVYWPGRHWPAFNIADSMLCLGVGLIIISSFRVAKRPL